MSRPVHTQDVPSTFCYRSPQLDWPFLVGLLSVDDDPASYNYGNATPGAEDRNKPWYRLNVDGTPDGWYAYANGQWLKRYAGPDAGAIMMWDGLPAAIVTLDGGEAGAITTTTGAFWEIVTAMEAKFPIGVGTLPVSGTVLAVGDTGGSEQVTLDLENIPSHDHGIPNKKLVHQVTPSGVLEQTSGNDLTTSTFRAEGGKADGSTKPHSNLPQYRAVYFIRRTARIYHRA